MDDDLRHGSRLPPRDTGRFLFYPTPLDGVWRAQGKPAADSRGWFARLYSAAEFAEVGVDAPIVQINHSCSAVRGTVRGLHFQRPPHAETKVVRCIKGRVTDVVVDIRTGSSTFLRWYAEELSPEKHVGLVIPAGFAHGFQTLEDDCELIYFHTAAYNPAAEGGLRFDDPRLGIEWPLPPTGLSDRDRGFPALDVSFRGVAL